MSEANRSTAVGDDGSRSFADEELADAAALVVAWDFEAARQVLDDVLDDPGPYPWDALRLRAVVRRELGDLAGALADAERAADGFDARYGPGDPDTVRALAVVGMVRHDLGDWDVAEVLYHHVLDSGVDEDGPAGRAVRLTRANFALLQRDRGDHAMAVILLNAAYAVHRREYGPDDLDTVRIAAELAETHRDAGDIPAARRLFAVAHAGASTRLGESHPFTRSIEEELAAVEPVMPTPFPVSAPPSGRRWLRRHATQRHEADSLDEEEPPIGRLPTGWPTPRPPTANHPPARPATEQPPPERVDEWAPPERVDEWAPRERADEWATPERLDKWAAPERVDLRATPDHAAEGATARHPAERPPTELSWPTIAPSPLDSEPLWPPEDGASAVEEPSLETRPPNALPDPTSGDHSPTGAPCDGRESERSLDGRESERSLDGRESDRSCDGREAERSLDGQGSDLSFDARGADWSLDGRESDRSLDGRESERSPMEQPDEWPTVDPSWAEAPPPAHRPFVQPHDEWWQATGWERPADPSTGDDPSLSIVDAGGEWWPSGVAPPPVRPAGPVPWQKLLIFGVSALVAVVVGVVAFFLVEPPRRAAPVAAPVAPAGEQVPRVPLGATLKDDGESLTVTWAAQPLEVVVALSRAGGTPTVLADLPAGATSYVVRGLDRTSQYCVVIGTVVDGAPLSAATSVCTSR